MPVFLTFTEKITYSLNLFPMLIHRLPHFSVALPKGRIILSKVRRPWKCHCPLLFRKLKTRVTLCETFSKLEIKTHMTSKFYYHPWLPGIHVTFKNLRISRSHFFSSHFLQRRNWSRWGILSPLPDLYFQRCWPSSLKCFICFGDPQSVARIRR